MVVVVEVDGVGNKVVEECGTGVDCSCWLGAASELEGSTADCCGLPTSYADVLCVR